MSLPYAYVPIHLCRALSPRGRAGNNGSHVREDHDIFTIDGAEVRLHDKPQAAQVHI